MLRGIEPKSISSVTVLGHNSPKIDYIKSRSFGDKIVDNLICIDSRGISHTNLANEDMVRNKNIIPLLGNEFIFGAKLPFIETKVEVKLQNDFSGGASNFYSCIRSCLFIFCLFFLSLILVIVAVLITHNFFLIFKGYVHKFKIQISNSRKYIKIDILIFNFQI